MPVKTRLGWTSVQAQLTLVIVAALIAALLVLLASQTSETRRIDAYLAVDAKEHGELLDRTLELEGGSLATFAKDYTNWGEMVRFVETGDRTWASVNIDGGISTYQANAAWVFDAAGARVYVVQDSVLKASPEPLPSGLSVKDAFGDGHFCHFFIAGPDGPIEIRGATIHPSDDNERKTPVRGYFLVARSWNRQYLAELARVTGKTIRIEPARAGAEPLTEIDPGSGEITFHRPLPGPQGKPELMLTAALQPGWIAVAQRSGRGLFTQLAALALLGVLGLTLVLWLWVTRPLGLLRRSLKSGTTEALKPLERSRTEFGQLAQLMGQFFGQNAALVKEVTERKQVEVELADQAERTKILFEYAPDAFYLSDFHGTFLDGNRAAEELLGYPREELVGKSFLKLNLLRLSEAPKAAGLLARNALGQATGPDELTLRRKDGTLVTVEICTHVVTIRGRKTVLGSARDITQRKRTEAALHEGEERFRELFESMSSGVAIYETHDQGMSFIFKNINRGAERIDSLRREEVVGRSVQQVFPGIEKFGLLAVLRRVSQTGRQERHPVGRYEDDRISGWRENYVYKLPSGEVVTVYDDVTARVQAEVALRESEEHYREMADSLPQIVFETDEQGRIVFVNQASFEAFGYTREDLARGLTALEMFTPGERPRVGANIGRLFAGENLGPIEYLGQRKDGSTFPLISYAVAVMKANRPVGLRGVIVDITERKQAEAALAESELKFRTVFESSSDAMMLLDSEKFLDCNEATLRVFGYSTRDGFLGKHPGEVSPPLQADARESRVVADENIAAAFRDGRNFFEWLHQRADGTVFPVDVLLTPLDYHGRKVLQATVRDITERKRAEEALLAMERELKRSNAELEQFAYIASHDLQEPLRMVGSYIQLLARRYQGKLDQDADEFISFAVDGASRMQLLINDLLTYSRVGRRGKEPQPADSGVVLERTLQNLKLAIEDSKGSVTYDPLPVVMADDRQLEQLFQNLIGNAIKYHGDEPPRVHVSAERGNGWWTFAIKDNGIGIEPQYYERIFQVFQRLHTRKEYSGTGIGLAVCTKIVERHGGRIWVESEPGKGSTFLFTLPAKGT